MLLRFRNSSYFKVDRYYQPVTNVKKLFVELGIYP